MTVNASVPSAPIKVLLADDHAIVRSAFASLLRGRGIDVVGETGSTSDIVPKYTALRPDVVLLDVSFGESTSGIDVAERLIKDVAGANVVFMATLDQVSVIKRAYQIGARAFLPKDCHDDELEQALVAAAQGRTYYTPSIAQTFAELHIHGDKSPRGLLSDRDFRIFKLLAEARTLAEISDELDIPVRTVASASIAIKAALGVDRQGELTRLAIRHGVIEP